MTNVAIPVTCGQAMEVPERMLNSNFAVAGDQAASMFNPGAVTSGYKVELVNTKITKKIVIFY